MNKRKLMSIFTLGTIISTGFYILPNNLNITSNQIINMNNVNAEENTTDELSKTLLEIKDKIAKDSRVNLFDIKAQRVNDEIVISGKVLDPIQKKEILDTFKGQNVRDDIKVFPFEDIGELSYGVVNLPVMQIRDNPKHSAQLITQALFGMGLKIIGKNPEKPDWIQVSMDDDRYIGWAKKSDIWLVTKSDYNNWFAGNKLIITDPVVDLNKSANASDKSGIKLFLSTRLNTTGETKNYYNVKMTGGNKHYSNRTFYIPKTSARYIGKSLLPVKITGRDLSLKAEKMISTPYLWGGASPNMTDCSGFTQMLYKVNGYMLPRDADQQQAFTKPVNTINELKSGDLVFFAENKGKRATHVGLYMGDKKFIHSSVGYGGVAITSFDPKDSLYENWYVDNFIGGGRVLK